MSEPVLLTRKQAAHYLTTKGCPISPTTLATYASNGRRDGDYGPAFYRDRRRALYDPADLDVWRKKRLVRVE